MPTAPRSSDRRKRARSRASEITSAWRWARAAPCRATFPPTDANLRRVGSLVKKALKEAEQQRRRTTVYADVRRWLSGGIGGLPSMPLSRATVQRRIEAAQDAGYAPRWTEEKK